MSLNLNTQARAVITALKAFDTAAAKTSAQINLAFQTMVDAAIKAGVTKDEKGVKAFMKDIRECEPFEEAAALGLMEKKTVTEYAQSAGRAFYHGVPFTANLKNDKTMGFPWGKTSKEGEAKTAGKSGKVESTSREELDKTARKLLAQMRILGLNALAAETLDVLLEGLEGFSETEPAKQ